MRISCTIRRHAGIGNISVDRQSKCGIRRVRGSMISGEVLCAEGDGGGIKKLTFEVDANGITCLADEE